MGKVATAQDLAETGIGAIPLTLGDPDMDDPGVDLIGDMDEDTDPAILALQVEIEGLKTNQSNERQFLQDTILELSSRPATLVPVPADIPKPVPTKLDFKDLPDPVEDRAGFTDQLGSRVSEFINAHTIATTQAMSSQQTTEAGLQDIKNRFTRDYESLSKKPAIFSATVAQEVAKLKNRGVNPQQLIFADPDKFLKTVAVSMRAELGIEEGDEDDTTNVVDLKAGKKVSRAKGVAAGSMPKLKKTGVATGKKPLSFIKEIKRQQHEMGLI